ncbi:MAG: hypothetical protein OHK0017_07630 [Patescibacteria group bacterium]
MSPISPDRFQINKVVEQQSEEYLFTRNFLEMFQGKTFADIYWLLYLTNYNIAINLTVTNSQSRINYWRWLKNECGNHFDLSQVNIQLEGGESTRILNNTFALEISLQLDVAHNVTYANISTNTPQSHNTLCSVFTNQLAGKSLSQVDWVLNMSRQGVVITILVSDSKQKEQIQSVLGQHSSSYNINRILFSEATDTPTRPMFSDEPFELSLKLNTEYIVDEAKIYPNYF